MTKVDQRRRAIQLRKQGKSYSEILGELKVSKSSLSLWLRDVPLTAVQIKRLEDIHKQAIEKYRETMKLRREKRHETYYDRQKKGFLPFSQKELLVAGLFLYWGEGNKVSRNTLSINNTDPSVVKFALYWIVSGLKYPKEKIKVQLHLYKDMNIKKEIEFWSRELKINENQFVKPYIKNSMKLQVDQKGFGHGTCGVAIHNTVLKENVLMAIKAISDNFNEKLARI